MEAARVELASSFKRDTASYVRNFRSAAKFVETFASATKLCEQARPRFLTQQCSNDMKTVQSAQLL